MRERPKTDLVLREAEREELFVFMRRRYAAPHSTKHAPLDAEFEQAIRRDVERNNASPKLFGWSKTADDIARKRRAIFYERSTHDMRRLINWFLDQALQHC